VRGTVPKPKRKIPGKCPAVSAVRPAIGELTNAKRCGGTYLLSRGYPLPTAVRALQEEGGDHTLNAVLFIDLDASVSVRP